MPGISALLDSDTENATSNFIDENSLISSVSEDTLASLPLKTAAAATKSRKRKCVTMPKKSRAKAASKQKSELPTKLSVVKRKATDLEVAEASEDELAEATPASNPRAKPSKTKKIVAEVDDEEQELTRKAPKPKSKPAKALMEKDTNVKVSKPKPAKKSNKEDLGDIEEEVVEMRSNFTQSKAAGKLPQPVSRSRTKAAPKRAAQTASRPVEVVSDGELEDDQTAEPQPPRKKIRTESLVRQEPSYRRRAGSASDTERGDPMLRRKLGDMTRRCESLDMKYRKLKDVAVAEANTNVEKLRRQCENITEASDKLVVSLQKQLIQQAPLSQESQKLKKTIQTQEKAIQTHAAETSRLRGENNGLSAELSAAKAEIKALQTKLATARATAAPEAKQPVVVKATAKPPAPPQSQSAKEMQLKIDLYGDLTGLIVHSVKQSEEGDTYDCIQTGKNGSKSLFPACEIVY